MAYKRRSIASFSAFRLYYVYVEKLGILPDFEIAEVKVFEEFPSNTTYPGSYDIFIPQIRMYEKKRFE